MGFETSGGWREATCGVDIAAPRVLDHDDMCMRLSRETHAQHKPRPLHTLSDAMSTRRRGQAQPSSEAAAAAQGDDAKRGPGCSAKDASTGAEVSPRVRRPVVAVFEKRSARNEATSSAQQSKADDGPSRCGGVVDGKGEDAWESPPLDLELEDGHAEVGSNVKVERDNDFVGVGAEEEETPLVGDGRAFKAAACVASRRANEVVLDGEPASRLAAATTRAS